MKGMLLFATGNLDAGMALVEEARQIHARMNDHEGRGVATSFLAQMTFAKGDHARALALYHEALASLEAVGDHPEIARVHCEMGWTALAAADTRARRRTRSCARFTSTSWSAARAESASRCWASPPSKPPWAGRSVPWRSRRPRTRCRSAPASSSRTRWIRASPSRIEALKASIPKPTLDGLVANASTLSPAAVLEMISDGAAVSGV